MHNLKVVDKGRELVLHNIKRDSAPKGLGAVYMKMLTDFADANKKIIRLDPDSRKNQMSLVSYYKRFGFEISSDWYYDSDFGELTTDKDPYSVSMPMVRYPK